MEGRRFCGIHVVFENLPVDKEFCPAGVVVRAEVIGERVVKLSIIGCGLGMVDAFNAGSDHQRFILITHGSAQHALNARLPFDAVIAVAFRVGAEGILHRGVKARPFRGRVGDGIVNKFVAERNDLQMAADIAPAAGERTHDVTEAGVGAVAAHHGAHTAK